MAPQYDIIIIGGGPAGLSAALTAARGNRSILVIDSSRPRNAPAAHMMNFPSRDGTPPLEFRNLIMKDLSRYPKVKFSANKVEQIVPTANGFLVDGTFAKKILLAHGVTDILPDVPGMKELFGKSIFHCPYCHGYEYIDSPIAVIGSKEYAKHMVPIVKGLSSDLILFTDGTEGIEIPGVKVYTEKIERYIHDGEKLKAVKLVTGEVIERSYAFHKFDQKLSSDLGTKLGCELTETGKYKITEMGLTTVAGVFAAGDDSLIMQSVLSACASGQLAGAAMNMEILQSI